MTAKRSTVDVLEAIDATLADYETDRREAWIDENLNQPGQMHVAIAGASWFRKWEDGEIDDDEAQREADELTAQVEASAAGPFVNRVICWLCGYWAQPGRQMHGHCRRQWAAAKRDRPRDATDPTFGANPYSWTRCLRPDGTGWGGGWDEENDNALPPSELVDGIGLTVGPHVFNMARLK